jgi:NADH-quinone oxidoreductase subunit N
MRRLMAYSGVAHAGYLLVGLAAGTALGARGALFYAIAYAVPSMGVMLVVACVGNGLADFRGLATRRPFLAWTTLIMLLSLVGVPPLAGFTGKLYLFTAAMGAGFVPLAVLALVMSAVSAGFYFRIVRAMFFEPVAADAARVRVMPAASVIVATCALAVLALGVASGPLLSAIVFAGR